MQDSLKSFLIEIECPSGAKLIGVLSRVIHAMALELSHPGHRVPPGLDRPEDIYTYLVASPGHALNYIFEMPWEVLMRTMNQGGASGGDAMAWKDMQEQLLATGIAETWTNPFVARVYPKPAEAQPEPKDATQEIRSLLRETLSDLDNMGCEGFNDEQLREAAKHKLTLLIESMDATQATPTDARGPISREGIGDGWGHTHEATTVQDLLREGDAMLKGTDKHEQMFKGMDDQQRLETACREIERLRADLTTLAKRVSGDAQRLGAVEVRQESMDQNTAGLVKDIQKLYRRVKTQSLMATYGGILPESPMEHLESQGLLFISTKGVRYEVDNMSIRGTDGFCDSLAVNATFPDGRRERWAFHNEKSVAMNNLRQRHQEIQRIIEVAKLIQKDPLLRKLFEA